MIRQRLARWFAPETRGYTDHLVDQMVDRASGTAASRALASLEAAARLWESGLAAADCSSLSPAQLGIIGRALLCRGEVAFLVEGGRVTAPASSFDVQGDFAPATWRYRLTVGGPSTSRTVTRSAGDVLHVRIGCEPSRPWAGVSPLTRSDATVGILAAVERSLRDEHGGPVGSIVPVPSNQDTDDLARDIAGLRGKAVLGETAAGGWGEGAAARPAGDWRPQRIGPAPDQHSVATRLDVERSIMGAAGVPVQLVDPQSSGDSREAWRRFLYGTLGPVGRLLAAELRRLGLPADLDFRALGASDLAGRARAYQSLVGAGLDADRAAAVCGF